MYKIMVPSDGSDHALKALHVACDLVEKYGGELFLVHIISPGILGRQILDLVAAKSFSEDLLRVLRACHKQVPDTVLETVGKTILEHAAAKVRMRGLKVHVLPIGRSRPADYIIEQQIENEVSTIVMGCRGNSNAGASSFGSVSNDVFARADCTCISVK